MAISNKHSLTRFTFRRSFIDKAIFLFIATASLTHGVVFKCEFMITSWSMVGEPYTCIAQVENTGSESTLEEVQGEHEERRSNVDVEFLYVYKQSLPMIPKDLELYFPNLKGIEWHTSELSTLSANDLKPFPDLKVFISHYNKLPTLDGDLFKFTPKLNWIYFHNNSVEHVGKDLLTNLKELTFVNFERNPCINYVAMSAEKIPLLISKLHEQCPPLETQTSETPQSFLNHIEDLENKLFKLSAFNAKHEKIIEGLSGELKEQNAKVAEQNKIIAKYEKRFIALESHYKELAASSTTLKIFNEISDFFYRKYKVLIEFLLSIFNNFN